MRSPDDLEDRMAELRDAWPIGSMVDDVMIRIEGRAAVQRHRRRRTLTLGLSLSGLAAAAVLAMILFMNHPKTLLAAVLEGLDRAQSAHITDTMWNDQNTTFQTEIWYRRGEGLRMESPEQVIVQDGKIQWSWSRGPGITEPVVHRQRWPGFFTLGFFVNLALPDFQVDWARFRTPGLDRAVDGRLCRGYTLSLAELEKTPDGVKAADNLDRRVLILAETGGRIDLVTFERRSAGGAWKREREIHIEYDASVAPKKVATQFPAGVRIVDCDQVFQSLYPIEKALHRVELGGLMLAVHDVQPMKDREGFYVVSSVRGTPEFLKQYPPRTRPFNAEISFLDVASQPMTNRMWGAKYDIIGLGEANRDGVEYRWWVVIPRRLFQMKDGKRVYEPDSNHAWTPSEPGRLDDLEGKARVPLAAFYLDDKHRDARGVQEQVSTWAVVPVPPDRPAATWEQVTARVRHDVLIMGTGDVGHLYGVPADAKPDPIMGRSLTSFLPDQISEADFTAAVRRGLDDMRQHDEIRPAEAAMPIR